LLVGLPYLGPLWELPRKYYKSINSTSISPIVGTHSYYKFKAWGDRYGPIYQVTIFGVNHIWLSSEKIAKELLEGKRSVYNSDRPAIRNVHDSKGSGDYLPLLGHNGMIQIYMIPLCLC
jgi:hypothetical protein